MENKKVIITVLGKDALGIIAKVCTYLSENDINILDISQNTFIVVGTGISGIAATELLLRRGAKVYLYDGSNSTMKLN